MQHFNVPFVTGALLKFPLFVPQLDLVQPKPITLVSFTTLYKEPE